MALSLHQQHMTIVGGAGLPLTRQHDQCLVDMVSTDYKTQMALGCWTHSVWRLSDLYTLSGDRLTDLLSPHWMQPPGWRGLVLDTIDAWEDSGATPLGPWDSKEIADRRFLAKLHPTTGTLDLVHVHGFDGTQLIYSTMRRVLRTRLHRHHLEEGQTPRDWLEPLGGAQCHCENGDHKDPCFVWAHDRAAPHGATETCPATDLYPVAISCRDGYLRSGGGGPPR